MITITKELLLKLIYQRNWKDVKVSSIELDKTYYGDGTMRYHLFVNDDGVDISKEEYEMLEKQLDDEKAKKELSKEIEKNRALEIIKRELMLEVKEDNGLYRLITYQSDNHLLRKDQYDILKEVLEK